MSSTPGTGGLSDAELREALATASEKGAQRALKELGLDDADAAKDIREMRALLNAWRETRKSFLQAVVKLLTTALFGALLIGAGVKLGMSELLK